MQLRFQSYFKTWNINFELYEIGYDLILTASDHLFKGSRIWWSLTKNLEKLKFPNVKKPSKRV